jgi:hypothetical protein
LTTSGTSTFNYTRDQIIRRALRQIGAFASGETPDAQTVTDCSDTLNMVVKEWDAIGIHLWTESEATLFCQPGQIQYAFGTGSTDHATQTNPPNYAQTALTTAAIAGASSISVASIADITSGDTIGVVLNAGSIYWTTVNGAPSGSTVTLAGTMPSAAQAANNVYDYTTQILRPLRIPSARRYSVNGAIETPMIRMSRLDYRDLPNKTNTDVPMQYFYDPQLVQGQFYLWPAPVDATNFVKFTWYRQIQDFNTPSNTPDLPQEWLNALTWSLAEQMAPEYDVPPPRFAMIQTMAAKSMDLVMGFDREPESVYMGVQIGGEPFSR